MDNLDEVIKMLDSMADAGISRMKVETSEAVLEGMTRKTYHHGRCDVGSPFATGKLYDLEEADTGLEQSIHKIVTENGYVQFLGIEFQELREGYSKARMKYKKELANPYGMLHGGSLYSMADIVAGTAACMCGYYVTTVSGTLNFLLPADDTKYVYCEAVQLRQGRHLAVYDVKITDDEQHLLDSGEFTFFVTEYKVERK